MAKDIWNSNDSIGRHRPSSSSSSPHRGWNDSASSGGQGRWWLYGAGLVVILLLWFLLIRPGWVGYQTYSAMQEAGVPEEYANNMIAFQQSTEAAQLEASTARSEAEQARAASAQCADSRDAEKEEYQRFRESFQADSGSKAAELSACEERAASLQPAIDDAARRICCVARVDNPGITGYDIVDNKITCVTEGGSAISC